ncbi:ADP-ribosylglycohydrolase family protein [Pseudonocardia nigra]|uniref:ADP-ribosylglycohydrolase family protein n=1 Tax=Pseudonocardia nigra TaxID=1921578 RepID=UPI001C5D4E7F|nr:ADP-ribosylglycohydrolase family protein [Pseudonocardia nigra]
MAGLAAGDALGRPAEGMEPQAIVARWGRIDGYVDDAPTGSDDTEYALLTAMALLRYGDRFSAETVAELWRAEVCTQTAPFRGAGFSEMAAIRNLQRGIDPPQSGQHFHAWSDGLAMRVAPIGIVATGDPERAAWLAAEDGSVSHSGEGILSGQAVAAAVAAAAGGADLDGVYAAAVRAVPADSWTCRNLRAAREVADSWPDGGWEAFAQRAVEHLTVRSYYWVDLGPEAVGLAFAALLAARGRVREAILTAVNLGRDADTTAAIAGAVAGAMHGIEAVPAEWLGAVVVAPGVCLQATAGLHPLEIADQLCLATPAACR